MKLNRVLSTFVLVGLLSGATMVAQAQTRIFFGFGSGPAMAAQYYAPPCPGPGYVWISGYYNGPYWVQGYWARRGDDEGYYGGGYGYYGNGYYGGDRGWRGEDGWRGRGWGGEDHHDNGWHRGWGRGRGHDH
ncbi:MAG: hypothetical protein M1568_02140 [Acidobacteria bacterium]|nr:hypothetical protein [Acidobacteriota bacterium]